LKQLLDRYHGDLSLALSAYNAGAGTVDRAGGIPQIPETRNYVANILGRLNQ
jgi:soluble lytic murein transglycosylase-like protein